MFSTVLAILPKGKLNEIIHRWAYCILLSSIANLKIFTDVLITDPCTNWRTPFITEIIILAYSACV